ncbi:PAAR-like domain-containing protein [Aliikangiella sp. IMCC44359]|uniref:PAAR-like domain-containing protein n=1 Tax=Aliikangiella sp. IMCC44359 TaxID=3459125 RepID=UPI00403A8178
MAKHDVFANNRNIIHKGSGDKAVFSAPDVCKTSVGSAIVPLPYPNFSRSSDLKKGSKSVKVNSQPSALKKSNFATSKGDQAGSMKGLISSKVGDKTEFISYSFDVKFEGQNVVRHADMTTHNAKNTIGMTVGTSTTPSTIEVEELKCEYCGKTQHKFAKKKGNSVGSGPRLEKNIFKGKKKKDHDWYTGAWSLQAHHLICSEAMDDDDWPIFAPLFGYNIDHENNGVMLPYFIELACQLHAPLHRGGHSQGTADGMPYPKKIKKELDDIKEDIKSGKYCDTPKALVDKLDRFSLRILKKIDKFKWTITADGRDYKSGGQGCAGVTSITNKPQQPCPHDRKHSLTQKNKTTTISQKSQPLEIGK